MDTMTGDTLEAPAQRHDRQPTRRLTREEQRELFRLRRVGALTALLEERADLRGVSRVADLLDDAVRWTA